MPLNQPFVLTGITFGALCMALGAWIQRRLIASRVARDAEAAVRFAAHAARLRSTDMLAPLRARRAANVASRRPIRKAETPSRTVNRDHHA